MRLRPTLIRWVEVDDPASEILRRFVIVRFLDVWGKPTKDLDLFHRGVHLWGEIITVKFLARMTSKTTKPFATK